LYRFDFTSYRNREDAQRRPRIAAYSHPSISTLSCDSASDLTNSTWLLIKDGVNLSNKYFYAITPIYVRTLIAVTALVNGSTREA
jgi:hypothetical protein